MYCIQKPGYKTTANVFPFFKKGYPEKEEQHCNNFRDKKEFFIPTIVLFATNGATGIVQK